MKKKEYKYIPSFFKKRKKHLKPIEGVEVVINDNTPVFNRMYEDAVKKADSIVNKDWRC